MRVPIPRDMANEVSEAAVRYARERMTPLNWSNRSLQALQPMGGDGIVGIKTTLKFLMYQERGYGPFLMYAKGGTRTLPLSCPLGLADGPHFRVKRPEAVGTPGYVDIPHKGQVWREQRWRHPGLKAKNFMHDGLSQAIRENQPKLRASVLRSVLGPKTR